MTSSLDFLLANISSDYSDKTIDQKLLEPIRDKLFLDFISRTNGGYLFSRALQIYGVFIANGFDSTARQNDFLQKSYGSKVLGLTFFGCDIFGNQFGIGNEGIYWLHIETGGVELIANDFSKWVNLLEKESNYYTGESLLKEWEASENVKIKDGFRLGAKKPFTLGGEYRIDNLYEVEYEKLILFNANLASQLEGLSDDTIVSFEITD